MRIIGGKYKGRRFQPPAKLSLRPTTDFAKESLFNILTNRLDWEQCTCLDLFSGTGSLTYECLSRGAAGAWAVEKNRASVNFIRKTLTDLNENATVIQEDVLRFLKKPGREFDLVLADPPYDLPELAELPELVLNQGWVGADGLFVLEHGADHSFSDVPEFLEMRKYGSVNFSIFSARSNMT
ncbi:MAG: 16S rRNA (guanine(966)-N(2))-methyltransferase RsmD [Flavobacteriales bacterium]|nr:16S rRNA (guanine(966)-N(2))-methyltransferase RsmD [Flavobacteriales bacterium]